MYVYMAMLMEKPLILSIGHLNISFQRNNQEPVCPQDRVLERLCIFDESKVSERGWLGELCQAQQDLITNILGQYYQ